MMPLQLQGFYIKLAISISDLTLQSSSANRLFQGTNNYAKNKRVYCFADKKASAKLSRWLF